MIPTTDDEEPLSIDWLLRFQPRSLERAFQTDTSKRRIRSAYRVDFAMFVGLALFMACGWPRVYDKGRCLLFARRLLAWSVDLWGRQASMNAPVCDSRSSVCPSLSLAPSRPPPPFRSSFFRSPERDAVHAVVGNRLSGVRLPVYDSGEAREPRGGRPGPPPAAPADFLLPPVDRPVQSAYRA